ncbi:hypothetical protein IGI04_030089 [Brassica rapa subsp. trilocularis]|uniref:Uncharacterized protein n=1 Tax=Brassica rapa subsp. trilocularis TaxID=1813537 RepID=A0ABQ7LPP7_BRACM|nr:hypothetical protein IGI04_030089 [Brassica rapa subsp. trilocularis]
MQLDTQKHEVSQYLQSAHANRRAEARVSRCMNTRHAEGQVDVEMSSGMAREHSEGHVDTHVSPRMRPDACRTTHKRSVAHSYWPATSIYTQLPWFTFTHSDTPSTKKNVSRERERERERGKKASPDQFIQDIEVGFWDLTSRYQDEDLEGIKGFGKLSESESQSTSVPDIRDGFRARIVGPVIASSNGTTKPVVVQNVVGSVELGLITKAECHTWMGQPSASLIEDRGTAILIEDRDREIPKRLRLCGVIVKGFLV